VLRAGGGEEEEGTPAAGGGGSTAPRSYVLRPIDGRLRYLRRGRDVREGEAQAVQEADVALDALSLHLSSRVPSLTALPVVRRLPRSCLPRRHT
jgi:hypothetical protein